MPRSKRDLSVCRIRARLLFILVKDKKNVIPPLITEAHIVEAIRRISHEGIPRQRRSRGYCLVADGKHFPPKYTIALAHELATGNFLGSNQFSGGAESNRFLRSRSFNVVRCVCSSLQDIRSRP